MLGIILGKGGIFVLLQDGMILFFHFVVIRLPLLTQLTLRQRTERTPAGCS